MFSDLRESMHSQQSQPTEKDPAPAKSESTENAAPTIESIQDPSDGLALWQRTVEILAEQKPLQVAWARDGAFLRFDGNSMVVGFSQEHANNREQLERQSVRRSVEEILSAAAGSALSIVYEVHDEISAPRPVLPEPEPEPDSGESGNAAGSADQGPGEIDEAFYEESGHQKPH